MTDSIIHKTPCTEVKRDIGDVITFPNFVREAKEFRNLLLSQEFYHFGNHPRGGIWNGLRTDSLISVFNYDHFLELSKMFLAATGQEGLETYQIEMYAEFHSTEEPTEDYIKQISPDFDYAGIVYLTPDAPVSAGIDFYMPTKEYNPYDAMAKSNYTTRDSVPNTFNTLVTFNPKEFIAFPELFGDTVKTGALYLIILLKQ